MTASFQQFLLVEDHPLFAEGVRAAVLRLRPQARVDWVASLESATHRLASRQYDMALLDLGLPDGSGIMVYETLKRCDPALPVAILSANVDPITTRRLIEAGANAIMEKDLPTDVLGTAIGLLEAGAIYVSPRLLAGGSTSAAPAPAVTGERLSGSARTHLRERGARDQELRVAELMCLGQSNRDIADKLGLREGTVKVYVSNLLRMLGVRNRTQATLFLLRETPPDTISAGLGQASAAS
ncbi:MAG: response regulator transcription factor [Burkholderiaceae bacterium]